MDPGLFEATQRGRDGTRNLCSKGLVGAVRKCLDDLGLLQFFAEIYGNLDGKYQLTQYDEEIASEVPTGTRVGKPEQGVWESKNQLVGVLMQQRGLMVEECILVEDDEFEVQNANHTCKTLLIEDAR